MSRIDQLSSIDASQVTGADQLPLYVRSVSDSRRLALSGLLTWFRSNFTAPDYETTVVTPGDGFTETVTQDGLWRWLLLRPTSSLATGTVVLPAPAVAADGQQVLVTTTLQIASFTVNGNGATAVYGAPAVLAAEDKFTLRYNALTTSWHCIG